MKYPILRFVYRFLLRLVPRNLRESHAREMERLFAETLDLEIRKRGWYGYPFACWGAVVDLVAWALSARMVPTVHANPSHPGTRWRRWLPAALVQDFVISVRSLRRSPGFTTIAALTLALGLGGSIAIFSVVDFVLLRPLPFPEPNQLYTVWETNLERGRTRSLVAPPTFVDWRETAGSFTEMSALSPGNVTLTGGAEPERVSALSASPNIFALLGVPMYAGSTFPPEAELPGAGHWVVLSFAFWQRWFGGDREAVGETLVLDDAAHTVIGVLPKEFSFPETADLWLPQVFEPGQLTEGMRGARYLHVIARVRPEMSVDRTRAEMATIAEALGERHANNAGWGVSLIELHEDMVFEYRRSLTLLLLATALVLVIACVNVVNLVLARTSDRRRERDVRLALGATRIRLFKESLIQHVVLAVLAGLVGATVAFWTIPVLVQLAPVDIPRIDTATIDGRVLLACLALSVSVGLVLSLVSGLSSLGSNPSLTSRSAQVGGSRARHRIRRLLIVTEVGLSLVLLIGAGLLLRSFVKLQRVDPGFSTSGVTTVSLSLPRSRYGSQAQQATFYREIVERISERREIQSIGATTNLPLSGSAMSFGFSIDGRPEATLNEQLAAEYHAVTPGYFRTMGIRLQDGRALARQDDVVGAPVVIINETFADRFWPHEDPLGKSITVVSQGGPTSREIVGVVANVRHAGLASQPRVEVYVPLSQDPWAFVTLVLRAPVETPVAQLVRAELAALDVGLPIGSVVPIEGLVSRWLAPLRFQMVLAGMFAVTALLLATLGIYGVISYVVSLRTNEIGVRMALGAHTGHVFASVVGQGVWLAVVGTVLGVVGAFWTTRFLSSQLVEVSTTDPLVFLSAPALVLLVALLGSSLPALRAVKVDPVEALRDE